MCVHNFVPFGRPYVFTGYENCLNKMPLLRYGYLILNVILISEFHVTLAEDECSTNSECEFLGLPELSPVCCKGSSRDSERTCLVLNCKYRYCITDGDCGGMDECCLNNNCAVSNRCPQCTTNSHCAPSEYCCKRDIFVSCVGEKCNGDRLR